MRCYERPGFWAEHFDQTGPLNARRTGQSVGNSTGDSAAHNHASPSGRNPPENGTSPSGYLLQIVRMAVGICGPLGALSAAGYERVIRLGAGVWF